MTHCDVTHEPNILYPVWLFERGGKNVVHKLNHT